MFQSESQANLGVIDNFFRCFSDAREKNGYLTLQVPVFTAKIVLDILIYQLNMHLARIERVMADFATTGL